MSKISLTPNASGTGTLSIASPSTNSDYTLTLPAETGTMVVTDGTTLYVDNANNEVGIGTTSPSARLDVRRGDADGLIAEFHQSGGYGIDIASSQSVASISSGYLQAFTFKTDPGSGQIERMRIDSSGVTSVYRITNSTTSADPWLKGVDASNTETSFVKKDGTAFFNGNLLVGTTSTLNGGKIFSKTGSGFTGYNFRSDSDTAAGTSWGHFYGTSSSNGVGNIVIFGNGNIQNANNSYGAISDVKLKENIVDATPKLSDLMQVRVRNYNFIGEEQKQIGVVAQELEQVFPGLIEESPDHDADGNNIGTITKGVKYSVFVPMLIKAVQEQQAIIESLTARIEALEAANVPT